MLFDKNPGLIINSTGIYDNTTGVSAGKITWENIAKIQFMKLTTTNFISIELYNPEAIINSGNLLKRSFKKINHIFFNTPVHVSTTVIDVDFDELADTISKYHQKYKTKEQP